ncbi:hypothetical protein I7819_26555, partial [Burkholderia multivorans]|uniref:hypothetical protein n=1 Tax=Burkholderia multivorans TaxID=87883 RepID=UPI001905352B
GGGGGGGPPPPPPRTVHCRRRLNRHDPRALRRQFALGARSRIRVLSSTVRICSTVQIRGLSKSSID